MEPFYLLFIVLVMIVLAWWIRSSIRKASTATSEHEQIILLQNQVNAMMQQTSQQMDQFRHSIQQVNTHLLESISTTRKAMDDRLGGAAQLMQGIHTSLGELGQTNKQILDIGKDISSLQETLRAPKLRGHIGELFLNELLAQIVPAKHYRMQYTFRTGETVDAVIQLKAGMTPIDAKFPLENFKRIMESDREEEQKTAKRNFIKDVKAHIDAIAQKYIRTDEGTFDFALMYIPAENVYYETIVKDHAFGGALTLFNYALNKRVIPVSPNSFYAYLQTILLGLRGMHIEESARTIMDNLGRVRQELGAFQNEFRIVGKHLEDSVKKYHDAEKRLGRIEDKIEQMDGTDQKLQTEAKQEPDTLPREEKLKVLEP